MSINPTKADLGRRVAHTAGWKGVLTCAVKPMVHVKRDDGLVVQALIYNLSWDQSVPEVKPKGKRA